MAMCCWPTDKYVHVCVFVYRCLNARVQGTLVSTANHIFTRRHQTHTWNETLIANHSVLDILTIQNPFLVCSVPPKHDEQQN